ncbi:MAG: tetratricopeptide repeat protein, partial [Cyclobacteriaceae bacterium]|nr:tetratricopeptide repeat protein [Cyclobacteriaceae bacterium]
MISSASGQNELSHRQRHLMQRADHYRLQQNYPKAIELYKEVVAEKSDYAEGLTAIAEAYYKLNDFENTMIWYD